MAARLRYPVPSGPAPAGGGAGGGAERARDLGRAGLGADLVGLLAERDVFRFGGRVPELRGRGTLAMLQALADHGSIEDDAAEALTRCYCLLRRVEHAIQMIGDEQTHKLPDDAVGIDRVARMLGYDGSERFRTDLLGTLRAVETHYAALFENEAGLGDEGNLVFTGGEPDPDTVETLSRMGYARPADIWRVVSQWHMGRYRAVQSERARERLARRAPHRQRNGPRPGRGIRPAAHG